MWSQKQTLLALLFAAIGLAAWWQLRQQPQESPPEVTREREPDYVVIDFSAIETDEAGKPSRQLVAAELRQYVAEDRSELEQPRMSVFQPDAPPWHARARRGVVLNRGEEVHLFDDVHIDREAAAQERPLHLQTEMLVIWPKSEYAETDLPVRVSSDGDWLAGSGMELWYQRPAHARFRGRVQAELQPADEARP